MYTMYTCMPYHRFAWKAASMHSASLGPQIFWSCGSTFPFRDEAWSKISSSGFGSCFPGAPHAIEARVFETITLLDTTCPHLPSDVVSSLLTQEPHFNTNEILVGRQRKSRVRLRCASGHCSLCSLLRRSSLSECKIHSQCCFGG